MNKDIIVLLLQKDIKELSLLTDGFEKMSEFPEPILRLARDKAVNVLDRINELSGLYSEELGAIDYESFGTELEDSDVEFVVDEPDYSEKNNFDAPLDSSLEAQINPHEIEDEEPETFPATEEIDEEPEPDYAESEHELENAIEESTEETDDLEFSQNEEFFTEAIESDEIIELVEANEPGIDEEVQIEIENEETQELIIEEVAEKVEESQPKTILKDSLSLEDKSLTSNLENQKIDDIRQAINIGDRFRFQRELFGGNGEVLNKTINYLNQLAKYSEAESFLKSKFGWTEDNTHAEEFLQIVKRRYL